MQFQKGQSGNPAGKEVGTKNHRTKEWESLGESITTRHTDRFNKILDLLTDEEFMRMFLQILEYFKPKLQRSEIKHEGEINSNQILKGIADATTDELTVIVKGDNSSPS